MDLRAPAPFSNMLDNVNKQSPSTSGASHYRAFEWKEVKRRSLTAMPGYPYCSCQEKGYWRARKLVDHQRLKT